MTTAEVFTFYPTYRVRVRTVKVLVQWRLPRFQSDPVHRSGFNSPGCCFHPNCEIDAVPASRVAKYSAHHPLRDSRWLSHVHSSGDRPNVCPASLCVVHNLSHVT